MPSRSICSFAFFSSASSEAFTRAASNELAGEDPRMRRARAAEGEQHEVARVETLLHGRLADDVGHLELGDPGDAARRLHEREAERRGDALHRVCRLLPVQLDAPAEEVVR